MPRYYHESSFHKQTRFIRKLRYILLFLIVAIALIGGYLVFAARKDARTANLPSQPTTQTTAVYAAPVEIFSTQYFQFQGNKHWTFVASESSGTKFVYRYLRDLLIEHELVIYVNPTQSLPDATRVLPVIVQSSGSLTPGVVSDLCKNAPNLKNISNIHLLTLSEVEFSCNPDSTAYTVAVGQKDGSSIMSLTRADGTRAKYSIIYKNLTARPDGREITELVSTFQAR